jgi:SAM-dependent methyltransferase
MGGREKAREATTRISPIAMSLRDSVRSVVDALLLYPLPGPFVHRAGNGWAAELPRCRQRADSVRAPQRSRLLLYEDRRLLGPPHAGHQAIELLGRGHYLHSDDVVLFSTSDNTDPNTNGRTYSYSISGWLHRRRSSLPVNYQLRDAGPDRILADVDRALAACNYAEQIARDLGSLQGKTFLEVGPGHNYATALVFACLGARPHVVDPYLAPWDEHYHPQFYTTLLQRLANRASIVDVTPIHRLLESRDLSDCSLVLYEAALEYLDAPSDTFDFVFSRSVVEHLYDPEAAFQRLFEATKPGGFGFHAVDFRDHLDFEQPLEFLSMPDGEYAREFGFRHGERGNRLRPSELTDIICSVGFELLSFQPTLHADRDYVQSLVPRLRAAQESRYRDLPQDELLVLGGDYRLRKP